jgi:hypothetical protein
MTCSNFVPDASEPEVGYDAPEYCEAGVDLRAHDDAGPYPLGCPKWAEQLTANDELVE